MLRTDCLLFRLEEVTRTNRGIQSAYQVDVLQKTWAPALRQGTVWRLSWRLIGGLFSAIAVLLLCGAAANAGAGGTHHRSHSKSSTGTTHVRSYTRKDGTYVAGYNRGLPRTGHSSYPRYPASTSRGDNGRIKRNPAARSAFERERPCPANGRTRGSCPGYVVDHVRPLECGGRDDPSNMQWQTVVEGKAKDKTEGLCR